MTYEATPGAHPEFIKERDARIDEFKKDTEFLEITKKWRYMALERKYMNNFSWLGRPLVQFPGDVLAIQELISSVRPTTIVETGIAHGGSLILSASMLEANGIDGKVIGVDIDIREHNRKEIENSRFSTKINLIEGSSIDATTFDSVRSRISSDDRVMVFLDSNHTHSHVLEELKLYSSLVSKGSYLVVFDTHVEDMPDEYVWTDRPWGKGDNPKTAVHEWLPNNPDFVTDHKIEHKVLITSAPDGFLLRKG